MPSLPPLARVRQTIPQPTLQDVPGIVRRLVVESGLKSRVKPGGSIAVGVGSRGIAAIAVIAKATVDALKELGYRPFIVAAMGSHGGATPEGQRELLAGYGVTAEAMGVEVRAEMDTVVLGTSPIGLPIHFDRNAHAADGIVLLGRVKPHTDFTGQVRVGHPQDDGHRPRQAQRGGADAQTRRARAWSRSCPAVGAFLDSRTPSSPSAWRSWRTPTTSRPTSSPSIPTRSWRSSPGSSTAPGPSWAACRSTRSTS